MKTKGFTLTELLIVLTILAILFSLVLGGRGGCMIGCNDSYSEGERVGVVSKFSNKGWQYKTWEGELVLGGLTSGAKGQLEANVWQFTVPEEDEESRKVIQEAQRSQRPVVIRYKEWMIRPGCQTDSGYMVQSVEFVKEGKPAVK